MWPYSLLSPLLNKRFCGKRQTCFCIILAVLITSTLFSCAPSQRSRPSSRDVLVGEVSTLRPTSSPKSLEATKSRYAFATLLTTDALRLDNQEDFHDEYFIATRILAYQILHASDTKSRDIPFIVLTTVGVSESKRERLRRDGAIVLSAKSVEKPTWIQVGEKRWEKVFDKLRLWELTQFERICFLDSDTILNRPLDGVFADPAVALHQTLPRWDLAKPDEAPLPSTYAFAGQPEMNVSHHYPPSVAGHDYLNIEYLNAGFFVIQPSLELLEHYLSIIMIPDRFNTQMPEQNLLNYAHRSEATGGNMPWQVLGIEWNIHYPTLADLNGGVASMHEKWWAPEYDEIKPHLERQRGRMEGFHEARNEL